jgi:transposase InsO family protein
MPWSFGQQAMPRRNHLPPLPHNWPASVKSAVLHAISLAQYSLAYVHGWAADSRNAPIGLKAKLDRANQEIALLREEMRIKDARMKHLPPHERPHYPPVERMSILELKSARNWSLSQTARAFLITSATIYCWLRRLDEKGADALVQTQQPVNRFPDYITYIVKKLRQLCPTMGKKKITETLARAGLHLGTTTVSRMLKRKPRHFPPAVDHESNSEGRVVTAKYPSHVWHVDLTVVPTNRFWTPWFPFSLPQRFPFCYWVAIVIDHFSRRIMGVTVFKNQPTSEAMRAFLGRTIAKSKAKPRYIVCDRGKQFDCSGFRTWCRRKDINPPRYGAIGHHGSIAVIERAILTTKTIISRLLLVPYRREAFLRELTLAAHWYNCFRPHTWLGGKTPNERYDREFPANRRPRLEPRHCWPRGSPCSKPWALVRGSPGAMLSIEVRFHEGRKHLPIVTVRRAA